MPGAKKRKATAFQTELHKSVFLYGTPNVDKRNLLSKIQQEFTELVNSYIDMLSEEDSLLLPILKNDKKDTDLRSFEKVHRPVLYNSAYSQNAFDKAVTLLCNRLLDIKTDMFMENDDIFTASKVLFAMSVQHRTKEEMVETLQDIAGNTKKDKDFYERCIRTLTEMSEKDFDLRMKEFVDTYEMYSLEYRIPYVKKAEVPVDSRIGSICPSEAIVLPFVISVSNPKEKRNRIVIPLNTSRDAIRRIRQYPMAGSFCWTLQDNGNIKVTWSYAKKCTRPETKNVNGVDTGIRDCLFTSGHKAFGSFSDVVSFYQDVVEPAFGELSKLREKKKKILHYVRKHPALPSDVRRSLIQKADRLERQMQKVNAPYRRKRHYRQMVGEEISKTVSLYISSIDKTTLTVLERLDIREFNKSRKCNGMLSVFSRGLLQKTLMETLNWKGYDFVEISPEYTSQVCPECFNLDKNNRKEKIFTCTCCGYTEDADFVGSRNIRERVVDEELASVCERNQSSHRKLTEALQEFYKERHDQWQKAHTTELLLPACL